MYIIIITTVTLGFSIVWSLLNPSVISDAELIGNKDPAQGQNKIFPKTKIQWIVHFKREKRLPCFWKIGNVIPLPKLTPYHFSHSPFLINLTAGSSWFLFCSSSLFCCLIPMSIIHQFVTQMLYSCPATLHNHEILHFNLFIRKSECSIWTLDWKY